MFLHVNVNLACFFAIFACSDVQKHAETCRNVQKGVGSTRFCMFLHVSAHKNCRRTNKHDWQKHAEICVGSSNLCSTLPTLGYCHCFLGAVDFFSINTLTTAIYNSWLSFDDLAFSNQLSFYLLIFILGLFIIEKFSRRSAKYHSPLQGGFKTRKKIELYGLNSFFAFLLCFIIFFLSFIFPISQMLYWTIIYPKNFFDLTIYDLILNTLLLVSLSSIILIIFSFISNYGNRVSKSKILNFLTTISISGYALPGIILAVAYITFVAWFDNTIISYFEIQSIKKNFYWIYFRFNISLLC